MAGGDHPTPCAMEEAQADAITSALRMAGLPAPDSLEATSCAPVMGWEGVGSPSASCLQTEPDLGFSITPCCLGEQYTHHVCLQRGKEKGNFSCLSFAPGTVLGMS